MAKAHKVLCGGDQPVAVIGLATVDHITYLHGGRIWAGSAPGHGARFLGD